MKASIRKGVRWIEWSCAGLFALTTNTLAGDCPPEWSIVFGGSNGLDRQVHALIVHDDGLGGEPALYAGGEFTLAGGLPARGVAKWDGNH